MITILAHARPVMEEREEEQESVAVSETQNDTELVMGPRQMAGMAFVAVVAISIFSGMSYLAGKSNAPTPAPVAVAATPPPVPRPAPVVVVPAAPLFADPVVGKIYLQIAAVERPVAVIFVEGLRTHKLPAFIAPGPGPGDKILRVLVGPLAEGPEYAKAKEEVQQIGFDPLPHKY